MREPITKCRACRGGQVVPGPFGPRACRPCNGTGLRAVATVPDKQCSCGARYDAHGWERLPYVGDMDDDVERLELRNCTACGSTIAIVVERDEEAAAAE